MSNQNQLNMDMIETLGPEFTVFVGLLLIMIIPNLGNGTFRVPGTSIRLPWSVAVSCGGPSSTIYARVVVNLHGLQNKPTIVPKKKGKEPHHEKRFASRLPLY